MKLFDGSIQKRGTDSNVIIYSEILSFKFNFTSLINFVKEYVMQLYVFFTLAKTKIEGIVKKEAKSLLLMSIDKMRLTIFFF